MQSRQEEEGLEAGSHTGCSAACQGELVASNSPYARNVSVAVRIELGVSGHVLHMLPKWFSQPANLPADTHSRAFLTQCSSDSGNQGLKQRT